VVAFKTHHLLPVDAYLRADGTGMSADKDTGGLVNLSPVLGEGEKWIVRQHFDGRVSFESKAYPNCFLRMDAHDVTEPMAAGGGIVDLRYYASYTLVNEWEKFGFCLQATKLACSVGGRTNDRKEHLNKVADRLGITGVSTTASSADGGVRTAADISADLESYAAIAVERGALLHFLADVESPLPFEEDLESEPVTEGSSAGFMPLNLMAVKPTALNMSKEDEEAIVILSIVISVIAIFFDLMGVSTATVSIIRPTALAYNI
jgi:hypothetical protein